MTEPYKYVRFRWWKDVDLEKVSEDLGKLFSVEMLVGPSDELEVSLYKDDRKELKVNADTLTARLSGSRAVLFQSEAAPLTTRDLELREKVLELYKQRTPTPFPWAFTHEPEFERGK